MLLDLINDNNNWLGRAQWGDPLFDGLIDEFRIYDTRLTAAEVAASFTAGPEPAPLPVLTVNRDTGVISLANQSGGGINVKGYSITSAGGALNPATWTSIDATNVFDPNGTWTSSSSTSMNIAEPSPAARSTAARSPATALLPSAPHGGRPRFKTSPSPSRWATARPVPGRSSTPAPLPARSDFNGDGIVNVADWTLFLPNSFTTFAADPAVAAYLKGDLDGDKDNDYADFKLFKADYIAANGEAAFAALGAAIPEPATLALGGLASLALVAARRRVARELSSVLVTYSTYSHTQPSLNTSEFHHATAIDPRSPAPPDRRHVRRRPATGRGRHGPSLQLHHERQRLGRHGPRHADRRRRRHRRLCRRPTRPLRQHGARFQQRHHRRRLRQSSQRHHLRRRHRLAAAAQHRTVGHRFRRPARGSASSTSAPPTTAKTPRASGSAAPYI